MRLPRVFLDANVIVDARVRDIFCRLGESGLIDLRWSAQILDEVRRALIENLEREPGKVDQLLRTLWRAFPLAAVSGFDHLIEQFDLPDPDDRHVVAAAVYGECDVLVTYNERDLPDSAVEGRSARSDDRRGTGSHGPVVLRGSPWLDRGAGRSAQETRHHYRQLSGSPGRASERLAGTLSPPAAAVHRALASELDDVMTSDGWGFATAPRLVAPDIELVKLLRMGARPLLAFEPRTVAPAHLFYLRRTAAGWVLVDLDGPDPGLDQE